MAEIDLHHQLKEVSRFLIDYAASSMSVGMQTSRVVRNSERIAAAWGFCCDASIFRNSFIITLWDSSRDHSYSSVGNIMSLGLNFQINAALCRLSWEIFDQQLPLQQAKDKYLAIVRTPRESRWLVIVLVSLANAAFCRLFKGDFMAMGIVCVATFAGFFVKQTLQHRHWNEFAIWTISAFVASMIASLDYTFHLGTTSDIAVATSVLFLIPGVPLINGIMDLIDGHVLSGTSRLINAGMLIVCIAIGLTITLRLARIDVL